MAIILLLGDMPTKRTWTKPSTEKAPAERRHAAFLQVPLASCEPGGGAGVMGLKYYQRSKHLVSGEGEGEEGSKGCLN